MKEKSTTSRNAFYSKLKPPGIIFLFTLLILLLSNLNLMAQIPQGQKVCSLDEWLDSLYQQDSNQLKFDEAIHTKRIEHYRKTHPQTIDFSSSLQGGKDCPEPDYIIPVVVHVIHTTANADTKIDSTQVFHQIEILNKRFGNLDNVSGAIDTKIQFCLAKTRPDSTSFNGINYIQDNNRSYHDRNDLQDLIDTIYYPSDKYINIYVVQQIVGTNPNDIIAGYATLPYPTIFAGKEAIVIPFDWFGHANFDTHMYSESRGLSLVHEMGHFLGLYHPWEGGCNISDCAKEGDKCCDVPQIDNYSTSCQLAQSSCEAGKDRLTNNYMDYAPGDCPTSFTPDQSSIMHAILNTGRRSLWQPDNVNFAQLECCQFSPYFVGEDIVCIGKEGEIIAYEYENARYSWYLTDKNGIDMGNQNDSNHIYKIKNSLAAGIYDVTLKIKINSNEVERTVHKYLQIIDCSKPLKDNHAHWYFGENAGIGFYEQGVFRDLSPSIKRKAKKPAINTQEGAITWSDTSGNLIFYGGSTKATSNSELEIFDKNHDYVGAGASFYGHHTATQGAITIPYPGKDSFFLVITNSVVVQSTLESKAYYSVIKQNPDGTVSKIADSTNILLKDDNDIALAVAEGMTIVPQCGDSTWWLIIPKYIHQSTSQIAFHLIEINYNGLHYDKVVTFNNMRNDYGAMVEFSPNGNVFSYERDLFTFCRSDGTIEVLKKDTTNEFVYGVSFSPDGKLLYKFVGPVEDKPMGLKLYQMNPFADNIYASKQTIYRGSLFRTIQAGPDDKLYLANHDQTFLSVINKPNEKIGSGNGTGNECELVEFGIPLVVGTGTKILCKAGLPNLRDADYNIELDADFEWANEDCYTFKFIPNLCCADSYDWDFGDGNSSSDKFPTHEYATGGTYTVELTVNGETISKTISIGIDTSLVSIWGPSEFCDASRPYEYAVSFTPDTLYNGTSFTYDWQAAFSTSITPRRDRADYTWSGADTVILTLKSVGSGCEATIKKTIELGDTVTIIDSIFPITQYTCPGIDADTIWNKTISDTISYQWYKRTKGSSQWNKVDTATEAYFVHKNVNDSTMEYFCVAQAGCTYIETNTATVYYYEAQNTISKFFPIDTNAWVWGAEGNIEDFDDLITVDYKWEVNWNINSSSSVWELASNSSTNSLVLYSTLFINSPLKDYALRRIVNYIGCTDTSSEIKHIVGELLIPPKDTTMCFVDSFSFDRGFKISKDTNYTAEVTWSTYTKTGRDRDSSTRLVRDSVYTSGDIKYHIYGTSPIKKWYEARVWHDYPNNIDNTDVGYSRTYTFLVWASEVAPSITSHPTDQIDQSGSDVTFSVSAVGGYDANDFQWQTSGDGVSFTPMRGETGTSLTFYNVSHCQDSMYYRCVVTNPCGTATSNVAQLILTDPPPPHKVYDYWMKDSDKDVGDEPNTNLFGNHTRYVFQSPDIWNRVDNWGLIHQNAEYKNLTPNHAYVKVRNKNMVDSAKGGTLRLYWTYGATGEIWDTSWLDIPGNRYWNRDSAKFFPMGGEITPDSGITLPAIAPGDSVTIHQEWWPPHPKWIKIKDKQSGDSVYSSNPVVCLYARIEECAQYPFDMTFPEDYDQIITNNTINNNNIATLNFRVVDNIRGNLTLPLDWVGFGRSLLPEPDLYLTFAPRVGNSLDYWDVYLDFDETLYDAWVDGGMDGVDLSVEEPGQIKIMSNEFYMEHIELNTGQLGFLRPVFVSKVDLDSLPEEAFTFYLSQYNTNTSDYVGGYVFELDNIDGKLAKNGKLYKGTVSTDEIDQEAENEGFSWFLVPNPASKNFKVILPTTNNKDVSITVTDNLGRVVDQYKQGKDISNVIRFNSTGYPTGVYYVRLARNGNAFTKKLIIVN